NDSPGNSPPIFPSAPPPPISPLRRHAPEMTAPDHPIPRLSPPTRATPAISPQPACLLFPLCSPPLSAPCSAATAQTRPDPWPSPSAQLRSVTGRPWHERCASSSTSSFRSTPPGLPTCASRAPMDAFCGAEVSTVDRRHDRPRAQLPVAIPCASSRVSPISPMQHRGCTSPAPSAADPLSTPCGSYWSLLWMSFLNTV
uniref:Uncharacterized protein n=7 Tax=Aegilops tauschii subsp. strangulata TaxID=200361 RepID=A0A453APJ2_AEGTS